LSDRGANDQIPRAWMPYFANPFNDGFVVDEMASASPPWHHNDVWAWNLMHNNRTNSNQKISNNLQ
jgi:hypothetical protein